MLDKNILLRLIDSLDKALIWDIEGFETDKNWGSERETAYILDLLIDYGFAFQSSFLTDGVQWLLQQRRGDSWMEEQWETAMALKCLTKVKEIDINETINAAQEWIKHKQDSRDGLWNDELWESSFVLWYFLESGTDETLDLIRRPMTWLKTVQTKQGDGSLVVPHYTAFYLILQSYLKTSYFNEGRDLAIKWFMDNFSMQQMWSDVCYSNGYALYGLLRNNVEFTDSMKQTIIKMVLESQDEEGSWGEENIEDTYAYQLGLRVLLKNEISAIIKGKQLDKLSWEILEKGFLHYYQYLAELKLPDKIFTELMVKQIQKISSLIEENEYINALLLLCILINTENYKAHKIDVDNVIEDIFGLKKRLIDEEEYFIAYHFLQTLTQFAIKNKNSELIRRIITEVLDIIDLLIKLDEKILLNNYIETGSQGVIYLSEAEGDLDLSFKLLDKLIESHNFEPTVPLFEKTGNMIEAHAEMVDEGKIRKFIEFLLKVTSNLYVDQQVKVADTLYQKIPKLIQHGLKYKDLEVLKLLRDAWIIESFIGNSHLENFWGYLLYNAILDRDVNFSKILLGIFTKLTNDLYQINDTILDLKEETQEKLIEASRIEFTLHKLKNQYKISLRLSQYGKVQAPVRVLDNFYIDQNSRNIILQILELVSYLPICGKDKRSYKIVLEDPDFLGWKQEACGAPPDLVPLIGCKGEDLECDLLFFLGRVLFLLLPKSIRDVFLFLISDKENPCFLQLQIDDIEIPWDYFHTGEAFLINELATGNIIMEPTEYKMIKPVEFGKDTIDVLIIGNPKDDLEYSTEEAKIIRDSLINIYIVDEIKTLLKEEATKENVINALKLGTYQLIHYAGHTFFNERNASKSGLILKDDKILTSHELETILKSINEEKSYHPIIFLNSCEASKIREIEIEEGVRNFEGITVSLVRGGALACVGNTWEVEDEAIKNLSTNFYRFLLEGRPVGEALMKARNMVYAKRVVRYDCGEDEEITCEDRSWGSPKLFGEVQMTLVEKEKED